MCEVRCISCDSVIDSEDSGDISYCEECHKEQLSEEYQKGVKEGYLNGFNDAIEFLEMTYEGLVRKTKE